MAFKIKTLNLDKETEVWGQSVMNELPKNDFIILYDDRDFLVWFVTMYNHYLTVQVGNETAILFGKFINDRKSFTHQLNFSLPCGYVLGEDPHASYDLLLNFETEPRIRALFWIDTRNLFDQNRMDFDQVLESMILAAYANRKGIATTKEDNTPYIVDQRNFFFFSKDEYSDDVSKSFNQTFPISIFKDGSEDSSIDFNLVTLTSER